MTNAKIRDYAKKARVKLWEIGERLGLNDANFSRKLRHELPDDDQDRIMAIIDQIAKEREG